MTSLAMPAAPAREAQPAIGIHRVVIGLLGLLAVQHLLLFAFLGFQPLWLATFAAAAAILLIAMHRHLAAYADSDVAIPARLLAGCMLLAALFYILGGEGRFLFANTDWQIRGAVLRDLVVYPWPWVYVVPGATGPEGTLLRVPLGMYLLPAAIGKLTGERAAELALLLQNSVMLGAVMACASRLFGSARERLIALGVFVGFSGMDVVGQWLVGRPLDIHLEQWAEPQFTAHVTQMFWVPQHALAGWIGALLYLLWRDGKAPLALFFGCVPLLALLSPFAIMGILPFAAHAGISTLIGRRLRPADIVLPALAVAIAVPALLYLTAGGGGVASKVDRPGPLVYTVFLLIEVGLPLGALFLHGRAHRFGLIASLLVVASLAVAPLGRMGDGADFVMRTSIPALAILSLLVAGVIAARPATERQRLALALAMVGWLVGLATPLTETARALLFPPSPRQLCSYYGVVRGGFSGYLAPVETVSRHVRPAAPVRVTPRDPALCWDGPWPPGERVGLFDTPPPGPVATFDRKQPWPPRTH